MFRTFEVRRRVVVVAAVFAGAAGVVVLSEAQGPPAQGAARPLVPMTASTILRNPDAHVGENVSMMAAVEAVLSKTVFTVDQNRAAATGREVLVIAPTLIKAPDVNAYVTVQGEVFKFDPDEVAKRARGYTLDLTADLAARYRGRPAVLATAVISPELVDLAKTPPRPMTTDELMFSEYMKAINPAFMAIRGGLDQPNAAELKNHATTLKKAFGDVVAFFKARGPEEALKMASEASRLASAIDSGLATGKLDDVKTSAGGLQQMCTQCHGQFRERMEDGTFRIRSGG